MSDKNTTEIANFAEIEARITERLQASFAEAALKQRTEFAEQLAERDAKITGLLAQREADARNARDLEFKAEWEAAFREGRVTEAQRASEYAIFSAMCDSGKGVNFGEGEVSPKAAYFAALKSRPAAIPVGKTFTVNQDAADKLANAGKSFSFAEGKPEDSIRLHESALALVAEKGWAKDRYPEAVNILLAGK